MCTCIIMFTALHRNHYLLHFIINHMRGKYIHTRSVLIALHRGVHEFQFFFRCSVPSSIRLRLATTLHIQRLSDGLAAPAHTHQSASPKRGASCPQIPTISTGRWTQQQTRRTRWQMRCVLQRRRRRNWFQRQTCATSYRATQIAPTFFRRRPATNRSTCQISQTGFWNDREAVIQHKCATAYDTQYQTHTHSHTQTNKNTHNPACRRSEKGLTIWFQSVHRARVRNYVARSQSPRPLPSRRRSLTIQSVCPHRLLTSRTSRLHPNARRAHAHTLLSRHQHLHHWCEVECHWWRVTEKKGATLLMMRRSSAALLLCVCACVPVQAAKKTLGPGCGPGCDRVSAGPTMQSWSPPMQATSGRLLPW